MNWYKTSKNKKKDFEEFNYSGSIRRLWQNMLTMEMDRANIHFDLENNDGYDIKTKNLQYTSKSGDQFRVKARICWAGGDWESSICYFKCQYEDRSYRERNKSWGDWSTRVKTIIIPEKSNLNLTDGKKGKVAIDADSSKSNETNDKDLWDEMEEIAEKRIKHYWNEYTDYEGDSGFKNTGCVRELTNLMTSEDE